VGDGRVNRYELPLCDQPFGQIVVSKILRTDGKMQRKRNNMEAEAGSSRWRCKRLHAYIDAPAAVAAAG